MCYTYKNTDSVSKSNREAEEEAKKKKEGEEPHIEINHQVLFYMQKPASQTERQIWQNKSAIYNAQLDLYE